MLKINKEKLVPGIVATWGDITGNVENQKDLVEYIDNHTPEVVWGGITGDIADQEDLQEELSGKQDTLVSGVNIKTVNDQSLLGSGNITIEGGGEDNVIEIVKVNGTALTPDVNKAVDVIVPTKTSDLTNDSGYLTDEDPVIEPLLEQEIVELGNSAAFKNVGINTRRQDGGVYNIGGDIYYNNYGSIFKFNSESRLFEYVCESPDYSPMWEDNSGNVHIGANYIIDLSTGLYNYSEIGGVYINNRNRHNIVKIGDLIYQISVNDSLAYIFDEENQTFWNHSVPCDCNYASWFERQLNFNGHIVYVRSGSMYELVPYFENEGDTYPTRLDCVQLSTPLYPAIDGSLPTSSYVAKANDVWYYLGKNDHTIYYLDEVQNEWKLINDFVVPDNYIISLNGAYANDDYVFGYGYVSDENTMLVWYFGESEYEYKFIVDINDKIETVDDKIPSGTLVTEENLKTINGVSIVGSGDIEVGGLTPEQEDAVEMLTNTSKGALYTDTVPALSSVVKQNQYVSESTTVYQVDDEVYYLYNNELLKFNKDILDFEHIVRLNSAANQCLWKDASGRLYDGPYYEIIGNDEVYIETGGNLSYSNGRCNILNGRYGVWCVSQYNLQKFDESTQKFVSGYEINLPVDYQDDLAYCMCTRFKYDGHILYESGMGKTYEIVEYEDHIDVVDVTDMYYIRPSFGFEPAYIFGTDSGLYYMKTFDFYQYNPDNQSWEQMDTSVTGGRPFDYRYAVTGDFVVGGLWMDFGNYAIINLGSDWKKTSWTDVKEFAVDLTSDQTINGNKNFKSGINTIAVYVNSSFYGDGTIRLGQTSSYINVEKNLNLSVPGLCLLNDKNIAITDQCILNRSYSYPGPRFEGVAGFNNMQSGYQFYFVTPSGRVIYSDPNTQFTYEFNGTQWVQLQTVTTFVVADWRAELNDGLYVINSNDTKLYKWDDTSSDWVFIINMPEQSIWAADANTLRCGNIYKLVNNGGTYEWDTNDPTSSFSSQRSFKVGQTYYYTTNNAVYTYDESVKEFTFIGNTMWADGNHWFTFNGCLYCFNTYTVRKVDPSQVGTDQWDTATNIYYSSWDTVYVEYDSKIWTVKYNDSLGYNQLGYTYDLTESLPAVPAQDGTYVLKATVLNGQVTYSWVVEV